jgi:Fe2+ transport system protein FeoA
MGVKTDLERLSNLGFGEEAVIERIENLRNPGRLSSLGIYAGQRIRVYSKNSKTKIIGIENSLCRYALSHTIAENIIIKRPEY